MANQRQSLDSSGFTAENDIDLVLGNANPNPTREGCPPDAVLAALARRELSIDDPAYDHLIKCSPCYKAVRSLQQAAGERRTARSRVVSRVAVAAVLALALIGASWFALNRRDELRQPTERHAQLDLRPYTVMRSGEPDTDQKPLALPRARLALTMLLPVGAEPGPYEVQLLDANLSSRASADGAADLENRVTTLRATLDAARLSPGDYKLAVRRKGEDWQLFPAHLE